MALIPKDSRIRLDIPHEPGEWIEIHPLTVRTVLDVSDASEKGANFGFELLRRSVMAWSYDGAVTEENLGNLDSETFTWLSRAINPASGERSDDEKKESAAPSPDGSTPQPTSTAPAPSRKSSGT